MRKGKKLLRRVRFPIQRARRGYSTGDTWSFNTYLAGVIAGGLRDLADRGPVGCPVSLSEQYGGVDNGCREWEKILRTIAEGFQEYHDNDDLVITPGFQYSFNLLQTWWGDLWD